MRATVLVLDVFAFASLLTLALLLYAVDGGSESLGNGLRASGYTATRTEAECKKAQQCRVDSSLLGYARNRS